MSKPTSPLWHFIFVACVPSSISCRDHPLNSPTLPCLALAARLTLYPSSLAIDRQSFFQDLRSIALVLLVPVRQLPWACSNKPHFENAGEAYCHNDAPQLAENAVNGGGTSQQAPLKKLGEPLFRPLLISNVWQPPNSAFTVALHRTRGLLA